MRNVHRLKPIVREYIPLPKKIHENIRRLNNLDDIENNSLFQAFIDTTERKSLKPKNKRRRGKSDMGINK